MTTPALVNMGFHVLHLDFVAFYLLTGFNLNVFNIKSYINFGNYFDFCALLINV